MILLNGKELSNTLYAKLENNDHRKLIILSVGDDAASKVYVRNKIKACEKVGAECKVISISEHLSENAFRIKLLEIINKEFNKCKGGIILQLPAPKKYQEVFNTCINAKMDVDGFGNENKQLLVNSVPINYPATPKGIMTMLHEYNINVTGKHVVIINRSDIVGKPLAKMMLDKDATVTICHSKTQNLEKITRTADILVVAVGQPNFIKSDHISEGVTIIDVGINRTDTGLCGDVDFEDCKDKCYAITPVPGGVGPMTVYSLIENVYSI